MSFLRWGNGGALTDPTSVPAREPSPARNSGKDKFLCPFSSLKKNPHPHPARKRMPSFVTGPNRQPPSSSQTAGERSQPAHIDACSLAYHIPSKRKEEQQSCPRNHPPHCPKSHTPRPRPSSSGGYSPPAPPYVFGPDSPKASKQATKISIPARVSLQSVLPVFCSLSFFGSCPHLADATAEIISEKPAYNNSVRKGQGQSMAALKLKRLLRKAQVFWRISKK